MLYTPLRSPGPRIVAGLLLGLLLAGSARAGEVRISEIRTDHPGSDTEEFFELSGTPGASLDGLFYIVVGDGEAGSGELESVTNLSGHRLDAAGYFAARRVGTGPSELDLDAALDFRFENADNVTHLLVRGFTGTIGQDLDRDDDGRLDVEPWREVLDALALIASDPDLAGDRIYARWRIGPDRGFVPTHVFRDGSGWVMGSFELRDEDTPGRTNATVLAGGDRLRSRVISR